MTASSSAAAQASQPAAIIFGPATPKQLSSGTRSRSAAMSAAPELVPGRLAGDDPTRSARRGSSGCAPAAFIAPGCGWRRG